MKFVNFEFNMNMLVAELMNIFGVPCIAELFRNLQLSITSEIVSITNNPAKPKLFEFVMT